MAPFLPDSGPDPNPKVSFTPDLFHQLPFRDYLDTETGEVPVGYDLYQRVVWNGVSYILFYAPSLTQHTVELCRWKLDTKAKSSLWLYADRECRRLVHILEALVVRDGEWAKLPLKVKVRGESYYSPLYSHPLNAVRYPMMGLTQDGLCGVEKRRAITQWLEGQGFDPEATQGQILGILDNVMESAEMREMDWQLTLEKLASIQQSFMRGQA